MGVNRYKVTYECDCGENYGSCEKRSFFLFEYNRSCDIGTLYHKRHADDEDSKIERLGSFTDTMLAALGNVLSGEDNGEDWTQSDIKEIERTYSIL